MSSGEADPPPMSEKRSKNKQLLSTIGGIEECVSSNGFALSMIFLFSFAPQWKASQGAAGKQRQRSGQRWPSESMTLLIPVHQSHSPTFKAYDTASVQVDLRGAFPHLVSSTRFVALISSMMFPLLAYVQSRSGACTGICFIASTALEVCDPKRIHQHRVFAVDAKRGTSSMGWFFGLKLHLAVNDRGERLACCLTPGNIDDRTLVPQMVERLRGKLIADRGSISAPLTERLFEQGLQRITRLRKHRKDHLMHLSETLLVRKRAIIASIIDQRTNISQLEHARHGSPTNVVIHLIAGLLASSHQDKKPSLHLDQRLLLTA